MQSSFTDAIRIATAEALTDPKVHVLGLGATYPNGLDGTMGDLAQIYPKQVHDTPCSENAVTGMAVGMAISGLKPLVHHGRIEFALHAMDQIITQAAKWNFMFGGDYPCPLVIRIAMGRQWGNGPQHTLNHKALFAVPGLKVVCPSTPERAYGLLRDAVNDPNPVIYLEPRWLYKTKQTIRQGYLGYHTPWTAMPGTDIAVVATGDMVLEAIRAAWVMKNYGVSVCVIDPGMLYPVPESLSAHLSFFEHTIVVDSDVSGSAYAGLLAYSAPGSGSVNIIASDRTPCPTATSMTASYYPDHRLIVKVICDELCTKCPDMLEPTFQELNLPPTCNFDDYL